MACIVYLIRAPRYEGISLEQIRLIESYLRWRKQCKIGSQYASSSFEEWGGHSLKELPPLEVIKYFKPFFDRKRIDDDDDINGYKCYGIFEQVARFPKASQFLNWIMRNVVRGDSIPFDGTYEVTREQLEQLLEACNQARRYGITYTQTIEHNDNYKEHVYEVNEPIARAFLPILEREGHLMFPYKYETLYAEQVITAIRVLNEILTTTNFETQTIYFSYG